MTTARPHDLLRVTAPSELIPTDAPTWVTATLRRTPWVVVRRANPPAGFLPIGVRGATRAQRHGLRIPVRAIAEVVPPEALVLRRTVRDLPVTQALEAAQPILDGSGFGWGPGGSVGFELATGVETITESSDLDLVLRAERTPPRAQLTALHAALRELPVRIDCQLNLPLGAVALAELVSGASEILLRTNTGPRLVPIRELERVR